MHAPPRIALAVLVGFSLGGGLAACGDSDDGASKADFIAAADKLCK